ncbi:hypothetical protein, conserved [Trypanosoma brucei gambiense DAL972]|uniref:Uncharacterized protein n=1 Tax=Trypanosoma brucei gambiense (strain MHOM/CI/86/DAL972) TaxID=679716 RepID=C9ZRK0_TRYB9|nr:hypothetical protein, conserved [Trypanosoma brucei gambiense DAL972]CBH12302.1 hypothetical protein, conserved [Trypanosoma brucei gambiense DAL972]|eukprot:XP_011774583.1 hypothetical protein, conserved [Trypanosoma brucei gambiense DAL972]
MSDDAKTTLSRSVLQSCSLESTLANARSLTRTMSFVPQIPLRFDTPNKKRKAMRDAHLATPTKPSEQPVCMPLLKSGRGALEHKVWNTDATPTEGTTSAKKRVQEIETSMCTTCARHVPEPQRSINMAKALDDMGRVYPSLSGVMLITRRYVKELASTLEAMQESHTSEVKRLEETVYKKYEKFFEGKVLQLIRENRKTEAVAKQLREEVFTLRKQRDDELSKAKEIVMTRLNDCERKEDEFNMLKRLVTLVFKTNQGLVNQVEDLSSLLRKHRIDVPKIDDALFLYNKPKTSNAINSNEDGVKKLSEQVSPQFIEASRKEMSNSRLTLQRELLNNAFDDCSAYRLQINVLRTSNNNLRLQVASLQGQIVDLEKYIHEKRFMNTGVEGDDVPLTPRPRNLPFAIQTDLGVDLKKSTCGIVAELTAVAMNLKHQLNSSVLALRRLANVLEWIDDENLLKTVGDEGVWGLIPVFPNSMWNEIPHFLRTNVDCDIPNLNWSGEDVSSLLYDFFSRFEALRLACRFKRDSKMFIPRVYQLFERIENYLVRLDATVSEVEERVENVPFGYVVTYFLNKFLRTYTYGSPHQHLFQSGTVAPTYPSNNSAAAVEMEFAKVSYNLWYAARRHKDTQPLCYLFVNVLDGRLPLGLFGLMERVLRNAEAGILKYDTDGSNLFTYNKLVSSVLKVVGDMDAQVGRCVVLAVAETFRESDVPVVGGRINFKDVSADEAAPRADERKVRHRPSYQGQGIVKVEPNSSHCRVGASVLTRFWRRLVIRSHEYVYDIIESILGPFIVESQVVAGVFLLPIVTSTAAMQAFDENKYEPSETYLQRSCPFMRSKADKQRGSSPNKENPQLLNLSESYDMLRLERTAFIQPFKDISLEAVFTDVLTRVKHIGSSIHFSIDASGSKLVSSPTVSAVKTNHPSPRENKNQRENSEGVKGRRSRSKSISKGKQRANESNVPSPPTSSLRDPTNDCVPLSLVVQSDKDVVEWYDFCAALRQTVISIPNSVFSDGDAKTERED